MAVLAGRAHVGRWEERNNKRKPLLNNVRFSGTYCGSLVLFWLWPKVMLKWKNLNVLFII